MTPQIVNVSEILARWSGPRRIVRTPDDDESDPLAPSKVQARLLKLLKTPKTIPQLADETGRGVDALSKAVKKMRDKGLVRFTGERGPGIGRPRLLVACEVRP